MGEVIRFRKPKPSEKSRGRGLCRSGFHKWEIVERPFDVKRGRLVNHYQCKRCGKTRTEAE